MSREVLISLSHEDISMAHGIAAKRNSSQRSANRGDGVVMKSSISADLIGAEGELAVSKALSLPWDGKWLPIDVWDTWKVNGNDVANLEVRSTKYATGRLILHDRDKDFSPFILVISSKKPVFRLAGWCYGFEGKKNDYWRDDVPRPCYMVPQSQLRPMNELSEILSNE